MPNYLILVVEDQTKHYEALHDYLTGMCDELRIAARVEHLTVKKDELEAIAQDPAASGQTLSKKEQVRSALIAKIRKFMDEGHCRGEQVVLFFDNLMQLPGGRFYLEDFIRTIWSQPQGIWEAEVPIIVYTVNSANGANDALPTYPSRAKSAVVNAYPPVGVFGLQALEEAVRNALS